MIKPLSIVAFLAMSCTVTAAELPVARVFSAPALDGPAPRGVKISPDGAMVTYLRPESDDQTTFDLWERPVKGGKERLLVEGSKAEPKDAVLSEAEKSRRERQRTAGAHGVTDYLWDDVGS
jgi:dipeptidyl-peptidase-4